MLSPEARDALRACLVTRGPKKGMLLAKAPSSCKQPIAYAAWMGAMLSINPYKASIGGMIFMMADEREIFEEVAAFFDAHPELRGADRDRLALEKMGVW